MAPMAATPVAQGEETLSVTVSVSSLNRAPRHVGQVPLIYAHTRSHEPANQAARYWNAPSTPL